MNYGDMPRAIRDRCARISEWRSPWKPDKVRKCVAVTRFPRWVQALKDQSGVYAIREAGAGTTLYVGRGRTDLKKALVRHFHYWDVRTWWRQFHHYFTCDRKAVEVKVYLVPAEWVSATEADLIAVHRPTENRRREVSSRTLNLPNPSEVPF